MNTKMLGLFAILITYFLSGCTALNTFPVAARAGDTVALAVGSPDGMTRSNTTAVFVSDSAPGNLIDVTPNIRSIFKLYPDQRSSINQTGSNVSEIIRTSGHEPWLTVMALDLPTGLAEGPGEVRLTTTANYPTIGSHINSVPIRLTILPAAAGNGSPSLFEYELGVGASAFGVLTDLEPGPNALIAPVFSGLPSPWPQYGAIEIKTTIPNTFGNSINKVFAKVVVEDMTANTASGRDYVIGINNGEVTVMLVSTSGTLEYFEARFSIVLNSALSFTGTPTITSVNYFDVNGNPLSGPAISDYVVTMPGT